MLKRDDKKSKELYEEPSIEEVCNLGCFIDQPLVHDNSQQGTSGVKKKKKDEKKSKEKSVTSKDIHRMFTKSRDEELTDKGTPVDIVEMRSY